MTGNPELHLAPVKSSFWQVPGVVAADVVFMENGSHTKQRAYCRSVPARSANRQDMMGLSHNMKVSLKLVLPAVMGLISAILIAWDLHNQHVITSMGMAWDTGAPLWPYQTADTVLFAVNTPAFVVSAAGTYYFQFGAISPMHHVAFFAAILAWWWLVGLWLDNRLASKFTRKAPMRALALCVLAIGLFSVGAEQSRWAFHWWWTYSRTLFSVTDLILLRLLAPSIWCFVVGFILLLTAWRYRRNATTPST
jgi:hypothetical protein